MGQEQTHALQQIANEGVAAVRSVKVRRLRPVPYCDRRVYRQLPQRGAADLAITVWLRSRFRVIQTLGAEISCGLGKLQRAILSHLHAGAGGDPLVITILTMRISFSRLVA